MQSRTTQFDLMMKTIMVVLFVFGLFVFFIDVTKAADWVNDPNNCPIEYAPEGVSCSGGNVICGVSGAACIDPALIVKRTVDSSGSQSLHSGGFDGGYLVNCTAIRDADGSPYCDNNSQYWCNRDASCYNDRIQTICLADTWAGGGSGTSFNCATISLNSNTGCISGYTNCSSTIAGCETPIGASCTVGGLTGSLNASCSCIVPTQNFVTGIEALFSTSSPLLWGRQYGEGDLISFSNATSSNIFVVKNDSSVFMSSTLATTTEQYFYNYNGDLYWGDIKLNTGGGIYTAGSGLNLNGYEFTVSTTQDFNWTGQHTFNTTTTFPLGVWGANGKVAINTTSLIYTFNVQMSPGDVGAYGLFANTGNLLMGFGNARGIDGEPNDTGVIALYYNTSSLSSPSFRFQATGTSWMASNLSIGRNNSGMSGEKLRVWGDFNIDNNGLLKFNGISGSVDQVIKINASGFPEWVNTSSLGITGLPSGSYGQTLYYGFSGWQTTDVFQVNGVMSSLVTVNNEASGVFSVAVGGVWNTSSGAYSFVGGGAYNVANNTYSSAAGGVGNIASGIGSFIGGGLFNTASGNFSTAFGQYMNVSGAGSFGINVSTTLAYLNSSNTIALLGGNVGVGTTTPSATLSVDGTMLVTETSTMHDVVPEATETYSLGTAILRWLNGFFKYLFADEATIASSTLTNTTIGTSTITNATIASSTITNLNATNATTTNLYSENLTVSNTVKSNLFCDVSGSNCFDPSLGWVVPITDVTTTPITNNGDFTSGTMKGYQAANAICDYYYPGYHFCFSGEIISFIRAGNISKFAGLPQAWVAEGPPGYTAYANDCGGYSTSSVTYLGAFWEYNGTTGGGQGWLAGCNNLRAISCCK